MNSAVFLILGALLLLAAAALLWAANRPADDREWRRVLNRHAGVRQLSMSRQAERGEGAQQGGTPGGVDHCDAHGERPDNTDSVNAEETFPPRRRNPRLNPQQTQAADEAFSHFGMRPHAEADGERADQPGSSQHGLSDSYGEAGENAHSSEADNLDDGAGEGASIDSPSTSSPATKSPARVRAADADPANTDATDTDTASEPSYSSDVAVPDSPADQTEDATEVWFANPTRTTRRARRSWAAEHGWQFDRNDADLAREWADHVGASPSEAKDVVSGRLRSRRAHVADINDNSYLGLRRSGSSDILIDFRDSDHWSAQNHTEDTPGHVKPPRPDQEYAGLCGGFAVFSSDPLSVRLMMDSRADRALSHLRGATTAIVIDPWWILVRCSRRPTIDDIPRIFAYIADLDDATRVLPNPTAEYLDMTDGDPGRAYSYDIFTLGDGPRMQAVSDAGLVGHSAARQSAPAGHPDSADVNNGDEPASQEEQSGTDAHIGWSDRPEFRYEYVDLPRRDRSRREGTTTDDELWDEVAKSTGDIPVVGSDPDHSGAHERSGRVIRVESVYDKSTIFGDQPSEGRHRKSSARRGASHRREDDDVPIVDGELEPENRLDQD